MSASDRIPIRHRGVTLIELLVVVAVLSILLGAALHMMQPVVKELKVREGSRMVQAYLVGAQARAAELGRPVAVFIEPFAPASGTAGSVTYSPTGAAFQMFIAETPPPFAGDTMNAEAMISNERTEATLDNSTSTILANYETEDIEGGFIRFNFRGPFYEITKLNGKTVTFKSSKTSGLSATDPARFSEPPAPGSTPYQIFPKPIKTAASPLDIPEPLAIDIKSSGIGKDDYFALSGTAGNKPPKPLIISFDPSGAVYRVYCDLGSGDKVLQPEGAVHLLVGWNDKLGSENRADFTTRWVSIGHTTGRIIVADNAGGTNPREFAEKGLGLKDRETN